MPKQKLAKVVRLTSQGTALAAPSLPRAEVARLVGCDPQKGLEIEYAEGRRTFAEASLSLDVLAWQAAIARGRRVLVIVTTAGEAVITGFVQRPGESTASTQPGEVVVQADGDRIVIQGREAIELRCGTTSLVLRKSGEVEIRGEKIVSRSRGPNILTGASIRLN
jgi:uncharacterized protein (DUF2345 family)